MPNPQMEFLMDSQMTRHYAAIGRVAVEWARLESYLREALRMLAGLDSELGECLTAQICSTERLTDSFSAISSLRRPGILGDTEFQAILKSIRSLANRRNQVVDEEWTFDPDQTIRWRVHVGKTLEKEFAPTTTEQVEAIAEEIAKFTVVFLDFRRHFLMSLGLWAGQ